MLWICFRKSGGGYIGEPSLFDEVGKDDLIMAFFPCIRFEALILLSFRGQAQQCKKWTDKQKMKYCMKLQSELTEMYDLVNMLFILCQDRGLKMIMENPYSEEHYLRRYWCIPPSVIDRDRRLRGDYYKKPTQYWFVNCEPSNNVIFEAMNDNAIKRRDPVRTMSSGHFERETGIKATLQQTRSMIHPDYANRFIREFIL